MVKINATSQPVCHRVQIIGVSGNNIYVKLQIFQARRTTSAAQQTKAQFIQDMCNQYMYFYLTRQEYVKRVAHKFLPVAGTRESDAKIDQTNQ